MGCAAPPSGAEEKMRGGDTFYALDIRVCAAAQPPHPRFGEADEK